MNADDIRAYKKRWDKVAEVERVEVARMSFAQKFADLSMLMEVARGLGGATAAEDEEEVALVRRRWNLLAERMGV
ncbi:hypothetical protein [Polyangium aurulentum]|uniref:hypothetical protein n=1 Tax=Polyangium aurulentum TaxID=2567896 RepID=UPI0010AE8165|nr:hypothetical protein [Polyangium aurulentum]UQA61766.1 hypothetical protein E8A73_015360 [Polyangium aurulentum]